MRYYVYIHYRADTKEPFYVGKGTIDRGYYTRAFHKKSRSAQWKEVARGGFMVSIADESEDENYISIKEKELIRQFGRLIDRSGPLVNENGAGHVPGRKAPDTSLGSRLKGTHQSQDQIAARVKGLQKKVDQYTLEGKFLATWSSVASAAKALNIPRTSLAAAARGRKYYPQAGGFKWRYNEQDSEARKRRTSKDLFITEIRRDAICYVEPW